MRRPVTVALYICSGLLLAFILPAFQSDDIVTQTTVLYDGQSGGTPDQQGFSFIAFGATSNQQFSDGLTVLDTMGDLNEQAGYFSQESLMLDRQLGYKLQFVGQISAEEHDSPHRSGFSIIIVSEDLLGLELAFWEDEIWAQEGGTSDTLFRHAEGVSFDTTAALVSYELSVLGDSYTLSAGGTTLLSGPLRDYTAFDGFPDVYETPGLLFLGDNTRRGAATSAIAYVAVETISVATATPAATETVEPTATPTMTLTPEPTQTTAPTSTMTATPRATATIQPPATRTPGPADKLYIWLPCLKGVTVDVQE